MRIIIDTNILAYSEAVSDYGVTVSTHHILYSRHF